MEVENKATFKIDDSTVAKTPGNLKVSFVRWFFLKPVWPLIWFTLMLVVFYLSIEKSLFYFFLFGLLAGMNFLYWKRLKEHFAVGCANPAKIIQLNPTLIAVKTDLRTGYDLPHCHSIMIMKVRLPKDQRTRLKLHDRLPTVSLYSGAMGKDRWRDFDPIPAFLVTNNLEAIDALESRIEKEEWDSLDDWYSKVPTPKTVGLYAFDQGPNNPRGATQDPPEYKNEKDSPWV